MLASTLWASPEARLGAELVTFAECSEWQKQYPTIERLEVKSTAGRAEITCLSVLVKVLRLIKRQCTFKRVAELVQGGS